MKLLIVDDVYQTHRPDAVLMDNESSSRDFPGRVAHDLRGKENQPMRSRQYFMYRQHLALRSERTARRTHRSWIAGVLLLMLPTLAAATAAQSRFAGVVSETEWIFSDNILGEPNGSCASGSSTQDIAMNNFDFDIPIGADIVDITVEVKSIKAFATDPEGADVDLLHGDGGNTFDFFVTVPGSGGNTAACTDSEFRALSVSPGPEPWGRAWTADEINASTFGARITARTSGVLADAVRITVTYTAPVLAFAPPSHDFGDVELGSTGGPMTVTLQNSGDDDATELSFSGLTDSDFTADTSGCGTTLAIGGSCEVDVSFLPTEAGLASATLTVASAEGVTAELTLTGNGLSKTEVFSAEGLVVDPEPLMTLSDGNAVLEPGERVTVAPTWRNDGAFAQFLTGTASDFTGPAGATYTLVVDHAEYGDVDPGANASCLDTETCYEMEVLPAGAPSPALHRDATVDETLSDETTTTWTLHLGDSFTDMPREHPFYRFVETTLHNGVTLGCTVTDYCPGAASTRGQMSVFVLRSLEGAEYQPLPCQEGEERFDDVPADDIFCSWIEDIANRGVVQGCGGGNFCPGDPVTRAQMAIFLLKTLEGTDYSPPECDGLFADVPCPSLFADWIEDLSVRKITSGCDATEYCPGGLTTRGQMAVFLTRTFGLSLYGP